MIEAALFDCRRRPDKTYVEPLQWRLRKTWNYSYSTTYLLVSYHCRDKRVFSGGDPPVQPSNRNRRTLRYVTLRFGTLRLVTMQNTYAAKTMTRLRVLVGGREVNKRLLNAAAQAMRCVVLRTKPLLKPPWRAQRSAVRGAKRLGAKLISI